MKTNYLITFFLCLTSAVIVYAQEESCYYKLETLLINKIKPYSSTDLIPYYSAKVNKWGFMHRITKRKITTPISREPLFFKPNLTFDNAYTAPNNREGCHGKIGGSYINYLVESINDVDYQTYDGYGAVALDKTIIKDKINSSIQGFEVDEYGVLIAFNSKFYDTVRERTLIKHVFQFQDKYYAVAELLEKDNSYYHIISQDGEDMPSFEKLVRYPTQKRKLTDDTDLWFLISDNNGKYILNSLVENKKLAFVFDKDSFTSEKFGYAIMSENGATGIFDIYSLSWKIKPRSSIIFWHLDYTSLEKVKEYNYSDTNELEECRKKVHLYIQANDNIFYDFKMNKYIPKI